MNDVESLIFGVVLGGLLSAQASYLALAGLDWYRRRQRHAERARAERASIPPAPAPTNPPVPLEHFRRAQAALGAATVLATRVVERLEHAPH